MSVEANVARFVKIQRKSHHIVGKRPLFNLGRIKEEFKNGDKKLASIMLAVVAKSAREADQTPKKKITPHAESMSPRTPELAISPNPQVTPDDEHLTLKMQEEVEEVVRRTPAIQRTTPPSRAALFQQAASVIKGTEMDRVPSTAQKAVITKPLHGNRLGVEGGSKYLYAMITPSKRMRTILDSEVAISPVRRSKRIFTTGGEEKPNLYSRLEDIPNLAQVGFLPNAALTNSMADNRRTRVKADPHAREHRQSDQDGEDSEKAEDKDPFN